VNKILAGAAILAALGGFWDRYSVAHVISSVLLVSGLVFQIFAVNVLNLVAPAASAIVYAGHCVLYGIMFPGQVWIISVKVIACLAILFALNNASKFSAFDREEEKDNVETIETKAGILSQLFFWWSLPMIVQGYRKKELVMSDLVLVSTRNKPEIAFEKFSVYYNQKNRKSLLRVLYEMNIDSFWNCGAILLFSTIVGYLSPIILQFLLDHIASDRSDYVTGIIISFILFATKVIQSVTEHQFWIIGVRCGMRCQSALMAQVYKKALKLSNSSLKKYSIGEIVNLMSVDACRISDSSVIQLFHWGTWCALLTSIISLVGLYNLLGYSMFFGIAIISSFWPVSIYLSRKVKATSLEVQKRKDQRARYAGNAVGALKLVKSLQWENYILKILGMKRDAEIDSLVKRSIYGGVIDLWSNITQTAAPIGTFLIFSLVEGKDLSASVVFTSLTWFSMLNRALSIIPGGITSLMDTLASMERLESFFTASEIWNSNFIEASPSISKSTVISIKDAGFSWNEDHVSLSDLEVDGANKETDTLINSVFLSINSTPVTGCLHDINLTITEGEMVFIVGPVGCGKSSLLSSIMGECFLTGGKMQVFGRKAYVSHNPWFQNTSIRENIIFGKPFNQSRYEDTLEACMLVDDLHRINGADLSEVGEDGCNLSGGQKQRLSLARAVYSDADLYLLDDVLSALDSHVGNVLHFRIGLSKELL
jgi:ABC-type multidrug transport system fused ATPase/permease subunit